MSTDIPSVEIVRLWSGASAVSFTRPIGPVVSIPDGDTQVVVDTMAGWGIAADGSCYFDPEGAAAGEHARLVVDTNGNAWLDPA